MRKICEFCRNKGNDGVCNCCTWLWGVYPTNYEGERFSMDRLKELQEPTRCC